jgi:hypothetical protein
VESSAKRLRAYHLEQRSSGRSMAVDAQSGHRVAARPWLGEDVPVSFWNRFLTFSVSGFLNVVGYLGATLRPPHDSRKFTAFASPSLLKPAGRLTWSKRRSASDLSSPLSLNLAERDAILKQALAGLRAFSRTLFGSYEDHRGNTVLVLADMRQCSLAANFNLFRGNEICILASVAQPLLQTLKLIHSRQICHNHITPWHVFWSSNHAGEASCSLPCPCASPEDVNRILVDEVPAEFFAPEVWVR